jgi:hypothetical protein
VVNYDPFAKDSRLMLLDGQIKTEIGISSNIQQMSEKIVNFAYKNNVYDVKIKAPTIIGNEIKKVIRYNELNKYFENKIITEIV